MSANVVNQKRNHNGFTTTSGSYVDLLDAAAGNTIQASITKVAGTDLLVTCGTAAANSTANDTLILGVNDGTTDYDVSRNRTFPSGSAMNTTGSRLLTGLGAATYVMKLRVRTVAGSSMSWATSQSSFITVLECNNGLIVAGANATVPAGTFSFSSTSYTDLLNNAGGSTITVSVTKASGATTNLVVRAALSMLGAASTDTVTLGVHDGTSTYDVAESRGTNSPHRQAVGEIAITGLAAGAYTLKLRVKTSGGNTQTFTTSNSASLAVMEINA